MIFVKFDEGNDDLKEYLLGFQFLISFDFISLEVLPLFSFYLKF